MNRSRFALVAGTAVLGLSALTACGGGDGYGAPAADSSSQAAPATGALKLAAAQVGALGTIVTDGSGRTVYIWDNDSTNPSKSSCDGDCAAKWPPVMAGTGTPQLDGIDASAVGTVTRADGSKQATLGGMPIYLFAKDAKAGDAKGQGVGGVWWVVGPDGRKNTAQASGSGY
ncbi:MAG TPA: hypothetical protein VFT31_00440 [Kribbella sp.]|nr:hypothetical protein [Kribbella sp.]